MCSRSESAGCNNKRCGKPGRPLNGEARPRSMCWGQCCRRWLLLSQRTVACRGAETTTLGLPRTPSASRWTRCSRGVEMPQLQTTNVSCSLSHPDTAVPQALLHSRQCAPESVAGQGTAAFRPLRREQLLPRIPSGVDDEGHVPQAGR